MSELTNLTINDENSDAQTFKPESNDNFLVKWYNSTVSAVYALKPKLSMSTRPSNGSVKRKVVIKSVVPYQPAAVDGVTPAIETVEVITTVMVPGDAPQVSIDNAILYQKGMLDSTVIRDTVDNGAHPH